VSTTVIARLDRAIQYSSDADDETEKPQRTGYSAFAEYDDFLWSGTATHSQSSSLRSRARRVKALSPVCRAALLFATQQVIDSRTHNQ
jgi:hypothetical protein